MLTIIARSGRSGAAPGGGGGGGGGSDWTAGETDNGASLPTTKWDTSIDWAAQSGTVHTVTTLAEFATALTAQASQDNPVIKVTANIDVTTSTLTLPNRTGAGECYICTDYEYQRANGGGTAFAKAPGQRATSSDTTTMRRLRATSGNTPIFTAAVQASPAHDYRIIGFEMTATATQQGGLVLIGASQSATQANYPNHILFDRCYAYGVPGTTNVRRFAHLNGQYTGAVDSTLINFYDSGATESQAFATMYSAGPYKIVNCDLMAAGECYITGGGTTNITPTDLEFRFNRVRTDPAWEGVYAVKNLIELKYMHRALIEGNIFESIWVSGQSGHAWHFKSTSQSGSGDGTQYQTTDIVCRYNLTLDYQEPFTIMGATEDSTQPTERVVLHDNVFAEQRAGLGRGRIFPKHSSTGVLNGMVVKNNIIESDDPSFGLSWHGSINTGNQGDALVMTDNVIRSQKSSGPWACDSITATDTVLSTLWATTTFTNNGIHASTAWTTGTVAGNTTTTTGTWEQCFTDLPGGDYSIASGHALEGCGTGGADPGPDIATFNDKIQYTLAGQRPSEI